MQPCLTSTAFDWIQSGRVECRAPQTLVCNLVPPIFQRYAKVLHRLDAHYENIDHPLSEKEIAILGIPRCTAVRSLVETKRKSSSGTRLRWREAAESLGVPYMPEINHQWFVERLRPNPQCWPRFIYGPADGGLDDEECGELVRTFTPFTSSAECFFRFPEIPFIATDAPLLFRGRLDGVVQLAKPYNFTPEYWWPEDQAWCLCSDYDLKFTLVGGESQLVDSLIRNEFLECIEVTANTRVDSLIPIPES